MPTSTPLLPSLNIDGITYPNAPILEAVIDLKVAYDHDDATKDLLLFRNQLQHTFPNSTPIHAFEFKVGMRPEQDAVAATSAASAEAVGWRLTNANGDRVLQLQQRGFTFSHLAPYSNWSSFEGQCRPLWMQFVGTCRPAKVVRLALRYINKIVVPEEKFHPEAYFTIYPKLPETVPDVVTGLFMQVQLPQTDLSSEAVAAVTVALMNRERAGETPVLLDIDMFTARGEIDPLSDQVWELLNKFRNRKNFLFESFITDETRKLFQ